MGHGADQSTQCDTCSYCRSCVGRNLANLELLVIVASIFRRYEFVLEDPAAQVRPVMVPRGACCG